MDSLGGYRLVRRLGASSRSEVWLGSDGSVPVAIKVFRAGAEQERIDAEIESLGRASGRHLVRLEDLAMGPNGLPCLILQRLSQRSLGRLLVTCRPSVGEAVTILAPLCLAVAELHRVGVAHGRIRGGSVLFDDAGAPVLASFGDAQLFGPMPVEKSEFSVPPAQLEHELAVAADLDGLAAVCRSTLDPDNEIVHWLARHGPRDVSTWAQELAERLFCLAPAQPVRFTPRVRGELANSVPSRINELSRLASDTGHEGIAVSEPTLGGTETHSTMAAHATTFLHAPDGLAATVFEWCGKVIERIRVTVMVRRVKDALRPVRKPVWIVAGAVAALVVAATAMMPFEKTGDADLAESSSTLLPPATSALSGRRAEIAGDDPLAAASALLDARAECFSTRSVLCLDTVDQRGASAMEADRVQVRMLQEGGASNGSVIAAFGPQAGAMGSRHIAVVERLGDSVLLAVTFGETGELDASFSLLLIRLEEGWRIRDLVPMAESPY